MKSNKLKTVGLIGLLLGGLATGGILYNRHSEKIDSGESVDKNIKQETWTVEEMEAYIKKSNVVMEKLQKIIDSPETNPEERFEARRAYKGVKNSRDEIQKKLNTQKQSMVMFNNVR